MGKSRGIIGAMILILLLLPLRAAAFTDVSASHPDYIAIEALTKAGIFKGYEDGTFKPDNEVNRAEALKIISVSGGVVPEEGLYATGFPDVPLDAWYAGYVMKGLLNGIVSGNPDGTFAAERGVNNAEFLKMTLLTFDVDLSRHLYLETAVSDDVPAEMWYAPYFSYAKTIGLIFPDMEYRLYPGKLLTRAECARILYKMLVIVQGGETQKLLSIAEARLIEAMVMLNLNNHESAVKFADEAVYYADMANTASPDSTAVQAVFKISLAFQKLFYAFKEIALAEPDSGTELPARILTLAGEAETLADEAVAINSTSAWLADKIGCRLSPFPDQFSRLFRRAGFPYAINHREPRRR